MFNTMDAYQVLVIILSVMLAIFLVLAAIAMIFVIKLMRRINQLANHAESVADNFNRFSSSFKKAAIPAAILKVIFSAFNNKRSSKE